MIKFGKRAVLTGAAIAVMSIAQQSHAEVINSLPGGTPLSFAGLAESKRLDDGRFTRDYDDFLFAASPAPVSTNHFVRTSLATANFGSRGAWTGPMMQLSGGGARGTFEFIFDLKQAAVLFEMNWVPGLDYLRNYEMSIFDANNQLLETATISYGKENGFFGFGKRQSADITKLTITGSEFGVRNMTVSDAVASAVPESSTWAMMLIGFFGIGGAMRLSRKQRRLAI